MIETHIPCYIPSEKSLYTALAWLDRVGKRLSYHIRGDTPCQVGWVRGYGLLIDRASRSLTAIASSAEITDELYLVHWKL